MTDERVVFQLAEFAAGIRVLGAALLKLVETVEEQNRILQRLVELYEQEPGSRSAE